MITVSVDQKTLNSYIKDLRKLGKIIANPNMQVHRANAFRKYTIDKVNKGALRLKKISNATKMIAGDHNPLWMTGNLLEEMSVRPVKGNAADVGYFKDDQTLVPGSKITVTKLAILQHTGYRIKTTGPEGQRVLNFLRAKGVFDSNPSGQSLKKGEGWINVPARPFMVKSMNKYEKTGEDVKAVDEFLDKLSKAPSEGDNV